MPIVSACSSGEQENGAYLKDGSKDWVQHNRKEQYAHVEPKSLGSNFRALVVAVDRNDIDVVMSHNRVDIPTSTVSGTPLCSATQHVDIIYPHTHTSANGAFTMAASFPQWGVVCGGGWWGCVWWWGRGGEGVPPPPLPFAIIVLCSLLCADDTILTFTSTGAVQTEVGNAEEPLQ